MMITPFESILAATDFSVSGNNAVRRAALLAGQQGGRLTLLNVVEPSAGLTLRPGKRGQAVEQKVAQATATLRRMASELGREHGVVVDHQVIIGDPFQELLQASKGRGLVVLGHGGQRRFKHLVTGKFAERFLRCCPCPVLAVKRPVEGTYAHLLVPVDFEPCSQAALLTAAGLAREGDLHVFHALAPKAEANASAAPLASLDDAFREEAGTFARLRRSINGLGLRGLPIGILLGRGPAVSATLRQAELLKADLLVAGKQGKATIARFLLGQVSRHLAAQAPCDVLIVPPVATAVPTPPVTGQVVAFPSVPLERGTPDKIEGTSREGVA